MAHGIQKIEKRVQYLLGNALLVEMENPQLKFITITSVQISPDGRYGKVQVSILGKPEEQEKAFTALKKARNHLQKILGRNLQTKRTPRLTFFLDESLAKNLKFEKIFEKLAAERAEREEMASEEGISDSDLE